MDILLTLIAVVLVMGYIIPHGIEYWLDRRDRQ